MENTTEPTSVVETPVEQTVDNTEPTVVDNTPTPDAGSDTATEIDVWEESFDVNGEPPVDESPEPVKEEPIVQDLNSLYKSQMDNADSKLDKPILIKLHGKVIEIDNINDLKDLTERGLSATKKYQEMSEDRKVIEFMNNNGISMETLNQLIKSDGSVPIESNQNSQQDMQVQVVVDKISNSAYVDDFKNGVAFLPDNVKGFISDSPELLDGLAGDFESGLAQKVLPIVERTMAIKGLEFIDAYTQAVQSLNAGSKPTEKKINPLSAEPRGNILGVKAEPAKDIWSMSSEEFKKYM